MDANTQLARMSDWLAANPSWRNDPNAGPRTLEDVDTLRRDRGMSRWARTEQRRPKRFAPDESGYLPNGSWSPSGDAA